MYTISVDRERRLVQVIMSGMLTPSEADAYMHDLRRQLVKAAIGSNYSIIVDVSCCLVQTQQMVEILLSRMATVPSAQAIAMVSTSALARMQMRRMFQQDYARIVTTVDEGLAWVLDGQEPKRATDTPDRRVTQPSAPHVVAAN